MAVTFNLVPTNAKASGVFIEQKNVRLGVAGLVTPRSIVMIGQYNDDKTSVVDNVPQRIVSAGQEDSLYGRGSMLALSIKRAREGCNSSIPIFALPVAPAMSGVKATGTITVTGTATAAGTLSYYIGGKKITQSVAVGATGAAITEALGTILNADLDLPLTSNFVTPGLGLTAKNAGVVGNTIKIAMNLEDGDATPAGLTVTIVQMANGANNPNITNALLGLGNVFYTDIHSPYVDATNLTAMRDAWEDRIDPAFKKPFVGFVPNNQSEANYLATAQALNSEAFSFVPNFESNSIPYLSSAYICGYASRWWQSSPGRPIRGAVIPGIRVPNGFTNPSYSSKNALVTAGATTLGVTPDNLFFVEDLMTTKKTNALGAEQRDLSQTAIISNLQTKIYSMDQVFSSEPFLTGIVVDDDSTSDLAYAIRPKFVRSKLVQLIDDLWVPFGLTKNRDAVVGTIVAEINAGNGGRIDLGVTDDLGAPLNIIAIAYNWGIGGGN